MAEDPDVGSEIPADLDSDSIVLVMLNQRLRAIEKSSGGMDALTFMGPLQTDAHFLVKAAVESIPNRSSSLMVVLETNGGSIQAVERIVEILRHHYERIEFLIPDQAMSAGTVLAMSGDAIHMDYSSVLGPIDPQVQRPGSDRWIPAQGYLSQYQKLLEKDREGGLSTAELNILISQFDQAEIYMFEQAAELSVTLLKKWLVEYKFKDWVETEVRGRKVSKRMKEERAEAIARMLNDNGKWHSHARGISMATLRRDLNLRIDDFGRNTGLDRAVRSYTRLLTDYLIKVGKRSVVHSQGLYLPY